MRATTTSEHPHPRTPITRAARAARAARAVAMAFLIPSLLALSPTPAFAAGNSSSSLAFASLHDLINPDHLVQLAPALQVLAIIAGTLISEDLTCITVGTLIHHHKIGWVLGGVSCFLGIYIGDLLFFFLGRLAGQRLLRMRFFSRSLGEARLRQFGQWFDRRPWAAIMACRFLPGIRVPLYLTVGALTRRTKAFLGWTAFFACVWTPALIALVVLLGETVFQRLFGRGWIGIILTILAIYLIVRTAILLSTAEGRAKLAARFNWLRGRGRERGDEAAAAGNPKHEARNPKQLQRSEEEMPNRRRA
jgi:membrane protein DedA with SNARE-associated domain